MKNEIKEELLEAFDGLAKRVTIPTVFLVAASVLANEIIKKNSTNWYMYFVILCAIVVSIVYYYLSFSVFSDKVKKLKLNKFVLWLGFIVTVTAMQLVGVFAWFLALSKIA